MFSFYKWGSYFGSGLWSQKSINDKDGQEPSPPYVQSHMPHCKLSCTEKSKCPMEMHWLLTSDLPATWDLQLPAGPGPDPTAWNPLLVGSTCICPGRTTREVNSRFHIMDEEPGSLGVWLVQSWQVDMGAGRQYWTRFTYFAIFGQGQVLNERLTEMTWAAKAFPHLPSALLANKSGLDG